MEMSLIKLIKSRGFLVLVVGFYPDCLLVESWLIFWFGTVSRKTAWLLGSQAVGLTKGCDFWLIPHKQHILGWGGSYAVSVSGTWGHIDDGFSIW